MPATTRAKLACAEVPNRQDKADCVLGSGSALRLMRLAYSPVIQDRPVGVGDYRAPLALRLARNAASDDCASRSADAISCGIGWPANPSTKPGSGRARR